MSINFKWTSRTKKSSSAAARTKVTRKPRGKEALTARKPASGWTIKLTGLKTSLAQIEGITEDIDVDNFEYYIGRQAALDAIDGYTSSAFVEGFLDGLMESFPDLNLAVYEL